MTSNFEDDIIDDQQPEEELIKAGLVDVPHPEPERVWGEYGVFKLVGHGEVTNPNTCGKHVTTKGCLCVGKHNVTVLDGRSFDGKVYYRRHPLYCYKSSCPVCYKHGWAVREAGRIEHRIKESSKRFGLAEHIVLSVPLRDYHLPFKALRSKAVKVAGKRGVIGGCLIFHGFRYKPCKGWYWSPHFHCIGFVLGGYARCRNCKFLHERNCQDSCDGFHARAWRLFNKDGWYVKVLGKRKTIFGTAWYQLHHSSYDSSVKNFHIATWFGVCSYRKLKVTPEKRKELCPICQSELVDIRYTGFNREQFSDEREGFADLVENGVVVWSEKPRRGRKGKSGSSVVFDEGKNCYVDRSVEDEAFRQYELSEDAKAKIDSFFPVCFHCHLAIAHIDHLATVGGRPVHIHCKEKLENGRKEVVC